MFRTMAEPGMALTSEMKGPGELHLRQRVRVGHRKMALSLGQGMGPIAVNKKALNLLGFVRFHSSRK